MCVVFRRFSKGEGCRVIRDGVDRSTFWWLGAKID